jgi:hypothetical protein
MRKHDADVGFIGDKYDNDFDNDNGDDNCNDNGIGLMYNGS